MKIQMTTNEVATTTLELKTSIRFDLSSKLEIRGILRVLRSRESSLLRRVRSKKS